MADRRTQRKFTKEFKDEALRLSEQPDRTVAQVAADLGVPLKTLYRWRSEKADHGAQAFPGKGRLTESEAELARMKRENEILRMERDILKKATAFFASQSHVGTRS